MLKMLANVVREEDGQGMVEYGLIIAGIALAVIVAIWALGPVVSNMFENITNNLNNPPA